MSFSIYFSCSLTSALLSRDWKVIKTLTDDSVIDLKPVHLTNPLGNKGSNDDAQPVDYLLMQVARVVVEVAKDRMRYEDMGYMVDAGMVKALMAMTMVKLNALGLEVPDSMQSFMIHAFVEDVQNGVVQL